jgi:hypothetical protein
MKAKLLAAVLITLSPPLFAAPIVAPAFSSSYTLNLLGSISGVPTNYGGLAFIDSNTILIGGSANTSGGLFYSVPVTRGAGGHIVSFGTPTAQGYGAYNDGGVAYGPGGVLFYSKYNINYVGEVKPSSNSDDKTVDLSPSPLSISSSTGALNFVPTGFNGANHLKIVSYTTGDFYDVTYSSDGTGTYNLTGATLEATLTGGPEGFIYVPSGSPLFSGQNMLVSEYGAGNIGTYTINGNGDPIVASRQDFVTGLSGAEGAAIDPVTGDMLFSTYGGGNQVYQVQGLAVPSASSTPQAIPTLSKWDMILLSGLLALFAVFILRRQRQ